ncbi:hypothetical protein GCM10028784_36510 [Myceligenerans cantabricum]
MTHTPKPNRLDQAEAAELIRDARALIAAVETGITRVGILFALAAAATIAAMKADLHVIAEATALIALIAFAAALLGVLFRITLGDPPDTDDRVAAWWPDDGDDAPDETPGNPRRGSGNPHYQ